MIKVTQENAFTFMNQCMTKALKNHKEDKGTECYPHFSFPYIIPKDDEGIHTYLSNIYHIYKDQVDDGCAKGVGYILNIAQICDVHPVYIMVTLYLLLIADANIYIIYDGSYYDTKNHSSMLNSFLDEFLNKYEKAKKVIVVEEMTYKMDAVLKYFLASHKNIKHIVEFGDFINFYPNKAILSTKDIQVHLPSAHYVIKNYSKDNISSHDRQILASFGRKCRYGFIDYAAYEADGNKHTQDYGFDIDVMYTDLAIFNTIKEFKSQIDKFVTIIFTDKNIEELNYPEEFYECFDVHFSKNYNDSILNYDFTQLFT